MADIGKELGFVTVRGFQLFGIVSQRPVMLAMLLGKPSEVGTQLIQFL